MNKRKTREKTLRRLDKKKTILISYLEEFGFGTPEDATHHEVLRIAYTSFGRTFKVKTGTIAGLHAHYSNVMVWAGITAECKETNNVILEKPLKPKTTKAFYSSYKWRKQRYKIIVRDGGRCLACGASPADGVVLNVDHIKPLKKYWGLRLDPDNLQTLCNRCNHGKSNWDETDWRD